MGDVGLYKRRKFGTWLKVLWINFGAVALALLMAEAYFWWQAGNSDDNDTSDNGLRIVGRSDSAKHDRLGWVLPANAAWTETKYHGTDVVYEATVTTNRHRLRYTPSSAPVGGPCVLFFGGSYTFGFGVSDDETLPAQVAQLSGLEAVNFGVPGYGPHQTLAALEFGEVDPAVTCTPRVAIYQGLNDHIARAAGRWAYGNSGPRYVLIDDGSVIYAGQFDDAVTEPSTIEAILSRSFVYRAVMGATKNITITDVELYVALLRASKRALAERYPGIQFHLLQWGTRFHDQLDRVPSLGIGLTYIDLILDNFDSKHGRHMISPYEPHPNPSTHAEIAAYVVDKILKNATADNTAAAPE